MATFHIKAIPHNEDIPALEAMRNENQWLLDHKAGTFAFTGRLLGFASSHRAVHNHSLLPHANKRCPACRWQEVRLFIVSKEDEKQGIGPYVVYTLGPSVIQGETTFGRVEEALTPHEVIELLTVRGAQHANPFLPAAAARALSQASGLDEDMRDAFENRRVA